MPVKVGIGRRSEARKTFRSHHHPPSPEVRLGAATMEQKMALAILDEMRRNILIDRKRVY